jgi:ankyrin repeat protein
MRQSQGIFWIKGNPGSGKSVLMKYALGMMNNTQPKAVVASFFIHGQGMDLQRSPLGLFRALLHSLLESFQAQLNKLTEKFNDYQRRFGNYQEKRWQWNEEELKECLKEVLIHGTNDQTTIIFVDALDECGDEDAKHLLEYFQNLMDSAERGRSRVKICLSSRHYPILGQNNIPTVFVENKNHEDIRLVVERRLSMLGSIAECQQIQEKILSKAQGGFQWVTLITRKVKDEFTSQKLETLLEMVSVAPGTLDELYAGITNHASGSKREQMIKLFWWVLFAKRPLAAQELREAIATDQNMTHRTISKLTTEKSWIKNLSRFEEHIRNISMGLVCFQSRELWETHSGNGEDWDREAQFIHQSAAEFARKVFLETSMNKGISPSLRGACHFAISRSCLKYLALDEVLKSCQLSRGQIFASFPLVPYIVDSLFYHIREIEQEHIPQLDLFSLLDWTEGLESLAAIWAALDPFHVKSPMGWPFVKGTVLHRLVALGSKRASDAFITHHDAPVNVIDEYGNTPLHLAIREDQQDITLMLLHLSIENQSYSGDNPNREGHSVNINIENYDGETPLDIALSLGAGDMIFKLVEAGAHLQSFGRLGDLIFHAIRNKDERLFAKLLSENVKLDGAIYFAIKERSYTYDDSNTIENFVSELIAAGANTKRPSRDIVVFGEIFYEQAFDDEKFETEEATIYASLCLALQTCQIPIVIRLLAYHVQLCPGKTLHGAEKCFNHYTNKDKWFTPLILASIIGYEDVVRALFDSNLEIKACEGADLHLALRFGRDAIARYVIEQGVDVNVPDVKGSTPLHSAAKNNNIRIIRLLIAKGANINARNYKGWTPLHFTLENNHFAAMEVLIEGGANVNIKDTNGWTSIHHASQNNCFVAVEALIRGGANLDTGDYYRRTPLHYASKSNGFAVIEVLIKGGASIDARDYYGQTPLHYASKSNCFAAIEVLIKGGASIDARDNNSWTPLHLASKNNCFDAIGVLTKGGANVDMQDDYGGTPLHHASKNYCLVAVKVLIEGGANVVARNYNGTTPLHYASDGGNAEIVTLLIDANADVNAWDRDGWSPLHCASDRCDAAIVRILLIKGADASICTHSGMLPLYLALQGDSTATAMVLFENDVSTGRHRLSSWACLFASPRFMHEKVTKFLIGNNIDVNAADENGFTPLLWAAKNGYEDIVMILINNGADVNARALDGSTPLTQAVHNGHHQMAKLLIEDGAIAHPESEFGVFFSAWSEEYQ